MATLKSAQVTSYRVRGNWRGSDFTEYGTLNIASAPAVGDIWEMVQVPNGYAVESVYLDCDQLDSNATAPTITLEVGDSGAASRYIAASNVARTGGVQVNNVAASTGYVNPIGNTNGNTGQFSGGNAGATTIQVQVTAVAATFKAGNVRLAVRLFQPSGQYT